MEESSKQTGRIHAYIRRSAFKTECFALVCGALIARGEIFGGLSPFSAAYLAACALSGLNIHYALAGCLMGSVALRISVSLETGLTFLPHAQSALVCLLLYGLVLVWRRRKVRCASFDYLLLLSVASVVTMPIFFRGSLPSILRGVISLCVSVLSFLVLQNALRALLHIGERRVLTEGEQLGASAFLGLLLLGVSDIHAFGFSLCVVLLLLYAMAAVLARGASGVAVVVALSAVLMLGGDFSVAFIGSVACCALAGAALRSLDTYGVIGGFVCASLIVGTHVYNAAHTINLVNLGIASLLFLLTPNEWTLRLCAFLDAAKERERFSRKSVKRMRASVSDELVRMSAVCREISSLYRLDDAADASDDRVQWIAQAAYAACGDCPLKYPCWKDQRRAFDAIIRLLDGYERGEPIRVRRPFDPKCRSMHHIAAAAWQAQNQYLARRAAKAQESDRYGVMNRQLDGVCDALFRLSERVFRDCWLDEELENKLLRGMDKRGYSVSGVEAAFPGGYLSIKLHMPAEAMGEADAVLKDVGRILHREMRLIEARLSEHGCTIVSEEAQQLFACMGAACAAISKSGVSGDSIGERRMERGRVLYALSDGMGAGEEAKGESGAALKMLFDLYDAGFVRDVALESVNRFLLSRKKDMYATLDAVFLDLRSGEAEFMKYGAPPSFVYRGKKLHTIASEALPIGIVSEAVPAISRARLRRRDALVLLSDGALDALGEQAESLVKSTLDEVKSSADAAKRLLQCAMEREQSDDMTVMVIRIA